MFKRKYFIYKNLFVVFNVLFLVKVVLILHDLIKIRNAPVQSDWDPVATRDLWSQLFLTPNPTPTPKNFFAAAPNPKIFIF
jgi:hypothetical protein